MRIRSLYTFLILTGVASLLSAETPDAGVLCVETEDAIEVTIDGRPLFTYNKATLESPEGIDPVYRRGGHIHPVYTPQGRIVSGDFPVDHPHQHAIFHAWRKVESQGRRLSFWDQAAKTGRVSHAKVLSVTNKPQHGQFVVAHLLEDMIDPDQPQPVLTEIWTVDIYDRDDETYVFDLRVEHKCAGALPVTVSQYHYGGMAFRGTADWFDDGANAAYQAWQKELQTDPDAPAPSMEVMRHKFLTSEGDSQFKGNHSRPKWVDLYGPIDQQLAGVAILGHPENFRAPQHVRLHPSKPYFCFSPMVESAFEITPEKPFSSRYRFVIHDGPPQPDALDAEWKRFAASKSTVGNLP
ncbi:MAG: PmoA family protein [Planctomycetaceae bacterium]|nr:PmoA family protein [Planctomycetaceae bacterium]